MARKSSCSVGQKYIIPSLTESFIEIGDCEGESLLGVLLVDISLHGVGADSHNVGLEVGKSRESLGESDDLVLDLVGVTESSSCDGMAL